MKTVERRHDLTDVERTEGQLGQNIKKIHLMSDTRLSVSPFSLNNPVNEAKWGAGASYLKCEELVYSLLLSAATPAVVFAPLEEQKFPQDNENIWRLVSHSHITRVCPRVVCCR